MIVTAFHFVAATCIMSCIYAAEHKLFLDRVVKMILSFNWVIGFLLCCLSLVGKLLKHILIRLKDFGKIAISIHMIHLSSTCRTVPVAG